MRFCLGIFLCLLVELTAFQAKDLDKASKNYLEPNRNGYSAIQFHHYSISKPHLISKRSGSKNQRRSGRRRYKDKTRRRKPTRKTKGTPYDFYQGSQTDGILDASSISADRINAKSMKADSIVADIIYADQIHGDTIIVTAKQEDPFLSEFRYDGTSQDNQYKKQPIKYNKNNKYGKKQPMKYDGSSPYNMKQPIRYEGSRKYSKKQSMPLNTRNNNRRDYANSYDRSTLPDMSNYESYVRPYTTKTNRDSIFTKGQRSNYRTDRRLWYSDFPEVTIIDTTHHPFISFQNGYVKRERIQKLRSRKPKRNISKNRRYNKRSSKTHTNYRKDKV